MKQLTIDTGVQEFEINGSGVLRLQGQPQHGGRVAAVE